LAEEMASSGSELAIVLAVIVARDKASFSQSLLSSFSLLGKTTSWEGSEDLVASIMSATREDAADISPNLSANAAREKEGREFEAPGLEEDGVDSSDAVRQVEVTWTGMELSAAETTLRIDSSVWVSEEGGGDGRKREVTEEARVEAVKVVDGEGAGSAFCFCTRAVSIWTLVRSEDEISTNSEEDVRLSSSAASSLRSSSLLFQNDAESLRRALSEVAPMLEIWETENSAIESFWACEVRNESQRCWLCVSGKLR
jgi:hypothetical protein